MCNVIKIETDVCLRHMINETNVITRKRAPHKRCTALHSLQHFLHIHYSTYTNCRNVAPPSCPHGVRMSICAFRTGVTRHAADIPDPPRRGLGVGVTSLLHRNSRIPKFRQWEAHVPFSPKDNKTTNEPHSKQSLS